MSIPATPANTFLPQRPRTVLFDVYSVAQLAQKLFLGHGQVPWVNRYHLPFEQLGTQPSRIGPDLRAMLDFFPN